MDHNKNPNTMYMYIPPDINIEKVMLYNIIILYYNGQHKTWRSSWTNQSGENIAAQQNRRKANWEHYKEKLQERFENRHINTYEDLEDQINQVAERTIPIRTQGKTTKWKPIWWDGDCDKMIQTRQQKIRDLRKYSPKKISYKQKNIALTRKLLRVKKKQNFVNFCNRQEYNIQKIWNTVRAFATNQTPITAFPTMEKSDKTSFWNTSHDH